MRILHKCGTVFLRVEILPHECNILNCTKSILFILSLIPRPLVPGDEAILNATVFYSTQCITTTYVEPIFTVHSV